MTYAIVHPDITGRYDPPGTDVVRQCPGRVEKVEDADVIFIPVARFDEFKFDPALYDIKKPWVLFDWCEFSWSDPMQTSYLWGNNRTSHPSFQNEEWLKFDTFVRNFPPIMVFQRELLEKDRTDKVLPLDYLAWLPELGGENEEDFTKRPIEVEFDWGRSHEGRMWLHGAIFENAGGLKYDVISQFEHMDRALQESGRKWLSVHTPHYARLDVRELQHVVRKSKISVVMPGAGQKTFRCGERALDTIMAMPRHRLAVAYPWNSDNSIVLPEIKNVINALEACGTLNDAVQDPKHLYKIYCSAMENGLNYRLENYARRWIGGNVERVIHA